LSFVADSIMLFEFLHIEIQIMFGVLTAGAIRNQRRLQREKKMKREDLKNNQKHRESF
jgi:hypothetical protein